MYMLMNGEKIYICMYIYMYIYIYCHRLTECFVELQLFCDAGLTGRFKLGSEPALLYARLVCL